MTTSATILAPRSQPALVELLIARMAASPNNLNSRGWQATQLARAVTEAMAQIGSSYESDRVDVFDSGFITKAKGPWLDLAATWYGELRGKARQSVVQVRLSDAAGLGPYTLPPRSIVGANVSSNSPLYYRCESSISVPKNGHVDVFFTAESAGAAYNVAPGAITSLRTPVPGVAVTSPAIAGQGTILVFAGADAEKDDPLRERCLLKWNLLGRGWAADTIRSLVFNNWTGQVTRMLVKDPGGLPGVAFAYLADANGPVSAALATDVYNFLKARVRKPSGHYPVQVRQSTLLTVPLTITLYSNGTNPDAQSDAAARLLSFQASLDLGPVVYKSRVVDVLVDVPSGIVGLDEAALLPDGDIHPLETDAVVFDPTWTVVEV